MSPLESLSRLKSRCWPGSHLMLTGEGFTPSLTLVGRLQFLVSCWTEGPHNLLTIGQRLPLVPRHMGLSTKQLILSWSAMERIIRVSQEDGSCSLKQSQK